MLVCRLVGAIRDRCIKAALRSWRRRREWVVLRRLVDMDMDTDITIMDVDAIMDMEVIMVPRLIPHLKIDPSNPTILLKDQAGDTDTRLTLCSRSPMLYSRLIFTHPHPPSSRSQSMSLWLAMSWLKTSQHQNPYLLSAPAL